MKFKKIFLILFLLLMCGCDRFHYYKGDRYDLLTVALNSLVGAQGKRFMKPEGPKLDIIEEDDYGRILFYYYENSDFSTHSILISQMKDQNEVYYYDNINFISNYTNKFLDFEIEKLKIDNDWNKSLETKKMIKKKIVKYEKEPIKTSINICENTIKKFINDESVFHSCDYITSDYYDNHLYLIRYNDLDNLTRYVLTIFNNEFETNENAILFLEDFYNYQNKLVEFKERNNWVYDYCA